MDLNKHTPGNLPVLSGEEIIELTAGDSLKIETGLADGGGAEILNATVPTGKLWNIRINIVGSERST